MCGKPRNKNLVTRLDGVVLLDYPTNRQPIAGDNRHIEFELAPSNEAIAYERRQAYARRRQIRAKLDIDPTGLPLSKPKTQPFMHNPPNTRRKEDDDLGHR